MVKRLYTLLWAAYVTRINYSYILKIVMILSCTQHKESGRPKMSELADYFSIPTKSHPAKILLARVLSYKSIS